MTRQKNLAAAGYLLSGMFVLFMILDIALKLLQLPIVAATMQELGWPPGMGLLIGVIELALVSLYLFPRTAILSAVLMTGLLGGAVATHLRMGSPLFSHILFGVYLGLFMWGGLWLRDPALRALIPLRRGSGSADRQDGQ